MAPLTVRDGVGPGHRQGNVSSRFGLLGRLLGALPENSGEANSRSGRASLEANFRHGEYHSHAPQQQPTATSVPADGSDNDRCGTGRNSMGVELQDPGKPAVYGARPAGAARYEALNDYEDGEADGASLGSGGRGVDMQQLFTKISARLLPLFFVMVIMCYVDRTSLAFAAIQLNADLDFAPSVFGLGSGLFFLGYSLFQVPSNLLLRRFGGPVWLASIIAAWGLTAAACSLMTTPAHFYALRLLLGATESGAFPGMWYVLTTFFPGDQITFPFAVVEAGISLSHVVAAPLAAICLSLDGLGGLAGWRWLFILEGLPSLGLAAVMYRLLPRSPETADFLTVSERRALLRRIQLHDRNGHSSAPVPGPGVGSGVKGTGGGAASGGGGIVRRVPARRGGGGDGGLCYDGGGDGGASADNNDAGSGGGSSGNKGGDGGGSTWIALRLAVTNRYVWYMGIIKFVRDIASFGLIFWAPTIVNSLLQEMREGSEHGVTDHGGRLLASALPGHGGTGGAAVLLTALPFALAAGFGMALAHSSQRRGERFFHIALPYMVTGATLTLYSSAASRSPWFGFIALSLGVIGVYGGSGPCLSLLSELAAGPGLVVALPLYNSIGTLGGFLGPSLVGWLLERAYVRAAEGGTGRDIAGGGFGQSAVVLGSALCLAGLLVLALGLVLGRLGEGLTAPPGLAPCPGVGLGRSRSDGGGDSGGPEVIVLEVSGGGASGGGGGSIGVGETRR